MTTPRRTLAAALALVVALGATACAPALPDSVVPGSEVTAAWAGEFTSANAAASPTPGNAAMADVLRGRFGEVVAGEFVADESFGAVTIVRDDPFTVRYDLAEPVWSDGIPLDAADLLLGWAAASGYFTDDTAGETEADAAAAVPDIDEFARAIDVTFAHPEIGWQQAVAASVPAHVVGRLAFGIDDAMEAKQAVIAAIQNDDGAALDAIAEAWNQGFDISGDEAVGTDRLLSSGPFLVDAIADEGEGRSVTLVPNPTFRGAVTPKVARIRLVPPGAEPLAALGDRFDTAVLAPTAADDAPVRDLERQDYTVNPSKDGTIWALLLKPGGVLATPQARAAFLRQAPASTMVERGGGPWASAYTRTTSMLSAQGSRAYDVVVEDSGFAAALGSPAEDPALDREAAGVTSGAAVCVLYDRASEFAAGAFAALRDAAPEAGWDVTDCGSDDVDAALTAGGWDAVITRVPVPQTPRRIAAQWGTDGAESVVGQADAARDALIEQYAQTTDVYAARELLAQIEATIVQAAVALPLAANPLLTVTDRDVTGVTLADGDAARVIGSATGWEVVK